jgi:hypothetical protein
VATSSSKLLILIFHFHCDVAPAQAGSPSSESGFADGEDGSKALFHDPLGVSVRADGESCLVVDAENWRIRSVACKQRCNGKGNGRYTTSSSRHHRGEGSRGGVATGNAPPTATAGLQQAEGEVGVVGALHVGGAAAAAPPARATTGWEGSVTTLAGNGEEGVDDGTVRVFRQKFTPEDAIGPHACSLEANMRVTNGIPLGCPLLLPVGTVNCVATLKVISARVGSMTLVLRLSLLTGRMWW